MRRIRCLRIRSIGMKKPRTAQPKEPVSDCSWCCFLRKIRFLASSPPPPVEAGGRKPSGLSGCGSVFFLDDFRFFRFFRFCVMVLGNTQAER